MDTGIRYMNAHLQTQQHNQKSMDSLNSMMQNRSTTTKLPDRGSDTALHGCTPKTKSFSRTLDNARSSDAKRSADQPQSVKRIDKSDDGKRTENVRSDSDDQTVSKGSAEQIDQARTIIRDSLKAVSTKLSLKVGFTDESIDSIDLENLSADVREQFAEILAALKSLSGLLSEAAASDTALDVSGKVIEPKEALDMEKTLRVETFRLEIAFNMMGAGADVNRLAAEKMGTPMTDGLSIAVDPSTLSMSKGQVDQIFSNLVELGEQKIESIVAKMELLAKSGVEKSVSGAGAPSALVGASQQEIVIEGLKTAPDAETKALDLLRDLTGRRPDGADKVAASIFDRAVVIEPKTDRKTEDVDLLSVSGFKQDRLPFTFTKATTTTISLGLADLPAKKEQPVDVVSSLQNATREFVRTSNIDTAKSVLRGAGFEESVVRQINENLSQAIKNGHHEVKVHLRPEALGDVQISIRMEGDIVAARIQVESQQVRQIVESNLQQLKDSLAEHNLTPGVFSVDVNTHSGQQNFANQFGTQGEESRHNSHTGNHSPQGNENRAADENGAQKVRGIDTGRRYGDNTVEMFI